MSLRILITSSSRVRAAIITETARAVAAVFLIGLAACTAVPIAYLPIDAEEGRRYGYKDTLISDGHHKLLVVHPGYDPVEKRGGGMVVEEMWHRRATELCGATEYDFNFFRYERQTVLYESYGGRVGAFEIEGTLTCLTGDPYETSGAATGE